MTDPDRNGLNGKTHKLIDTDPEWRSILESFGDKIERSPWPEQPEPPPKPEPVYSVQPWKDTGFYAVMKQVTGGKKDLVVVAAFKKGADEVVKLLEGKDRQSAMKDREIANLRHQVRLARYDAGP